jgi:hypothetical protein
MSMRRLLVASFLGLLLTASASFAADDSTTGLTMAPTVTAAAATSLVQRTDFVANVKRAQHSLEPRRPMALPALYAGSALLQGYDAYSTLTVLKHGGVEANPMMKSLTKSPVAFIGLKAGMATMSILAAERMWKRGNRVGAIATMAASNVFMAYVAANNARVLGQVTR